MSHLCSCTAAGAQAGHKGHKGQPTGMAARPHGTMPHLQLQALEAQWALAAALCPLHDALRQGTRAVCSRWLAATWAESMAAKPGLHRLRLSSCRAAGGKQVRCKTARALRPCEPARTDAAQLTCRWKWCLRAAVRRKGRRAETSVRSGEAPAHVRDASLLLPYCGNMRPRAHPHGHMPPTSRKAPLTCRQWAPPDPLVCSPPGRWGMCHR